MMLTEEEQKIKWAVSGEQWKPDAAASKKRLFPDSLRERTSVWLEAKHSSMGGPLGQRKRDAKVQRKFGLNHQVTRQNNDF